MASPADLRILSVTTHPYPPQHYGGSEMSTRDMCMSLRRSRSSNRARRSGAQIECAEQLVALGVPTLVYVRDVLFERLSAPYFEHPLLSYVANSAFTAGAVRSRFGIACDVIPPIVRRAAYETETERTHVVFVTPHQFKSVRTMFALARRLPQCKFLVVESWPLGPWERVKLRIAAQRMGNAAPAASTRPEVDERRLTAALMAKFNAMLAR
jgi:hypothetical protein